MMKLFLMLFFSFTALTSVFGCNGGNSATSNSNGTINQTPQFLATAGNQRFISNGITFHFGSDASFEMILNRKINTKTAAQYSDAQCNIRITGSTAYYQQKATAIHNGISLSGPILELTVNQAQVVSSQLLTPASETGLTADSICNEYSQNLAAKKLIDFSVVELASDHLILGEQQDFGTATATIWSDSVDHLGMTAMNSYFVRDGGSLDITASFLKVFSDSTYETDTDSNPSSVGEARLTLDGGLKEMTISDDRCGLKYVIDIDSIKTDGGTPILHGKIADSAIAIPTAASSNADLPKCSDLQTMIENVGTSGGMEISGLQNICTDSSCTRFFSDLRIGEPGTLADFSAIDSIMLSFQSKTSGTIK